LPKFLTEERERESKEVKAKMERQPVALRSKKSSLRLRTSGDM